MAEFVNSIEAQWDRGSSGLKAVGSTPSISSLTALAEDIEKVLDAVRSEAGIAADRLLGPAPVNSIMGQTGEAPPQSALHNLEANLRSIRRIARQTQEHVGRLASI